MQIDWVTGSVTTLPELSPGYDAGRYLQLGPDGEWLKEWAAKKSVRTDEGSFSRNFTVWTPTRGKLFISGNPVKLLQGHNAFGSCDAVGLYLSAGIFVREHAGLFPGPSTWRSCKFSGPEFTRLDVTRSYRFPSVAYANEWLRAVASTARDRRGSTQSKEGTIYFGKTSTRWTMKIYEKSAELIHGMKKSGHGIPAAVLDWSAGVVRFEATVRRPELEKLPELVSRLRGAGSEAACFDLWTEYYNRITWNGNADMKKADLIEESLPGHLRLKLEAWRGGADLRRILSKPSFYRVRRELLDTLGVDIASPPPVTSGDAPSVTSGLDPAGWDPEPLAAFYREPGAELADSYKLL
jgi:hypothetical protein